MFYICNITKWYITFVSLSDVLHLHHTAKYYICNTKWYITFVSFLDTPVPMMYYKGTYITLYYKVMYYICITKWYITFVSVSDSPVPVMFYKVTYIILLQSDVYITFVRQSDILHLYYKVIYYICISFWEPSAYDVLQSDIYYILLQSDVFVVSSDILHLYQFLTAQCLWCITKWHISYCITKGYITFVFSSDILHL